MTSQMMCKVVKMMAKADVTVLTSVPDRCGFLVSLGESYAIADALKRLNEDPAL